MNREKNGKNILIIEDNYETVEVLKFYLKNSFNLFVAKNGNEAFAILEKESVDIVLLDINLPDTSGFRICERIRSNSRKLGNPFIIILTSCTDTNDVIKGLKIGADDYVRKPFDGEELFLRINKFLGLRKVNENSLEYKGIIIDTVSKIVKIYGEEIAVSKKEYELLVYFILNRGITLSREMILENIDDDFLDVNEQSIDQIIKRLRKKIPVLKEYIVAKRGFGYMLV